MASENEQKSGIRKLFSINIYTKVFLAIASFLSFWYLFNLKFAAVMMVSVGLHELSHCYAMNYFGMKNVGFIFIPFLGGAAIPKEKYDCYRKKAYIALAGPVGGFIFALITYSLYYLTHWVFFAAAALWMIILNFVNVFPIVPMDGGQITKSIIFSINKYLGYAFCILSIVAVVAFVMKTKITILYLLAIIGVIDLFVEFNARKELEDFKKLCEQSMKVNPTEEWKAYCQDRYETWEKDVLPRSMNKSQMIVLTSTYLLTSAAMMITMHFISKISGAGAFEYFFK